MSAAEVMHCSGGRIPIIYESPFMATTAEPPPAHRPSAVVHTQLNRTKEFERQQQEHERVLTPSNYSINIILSSNINEKFIFFPDQVIPSAAQVLHSEASREPTRRTREQSMQFVQLLYDRYPITWQGLLVLKSDQAAIQMHYVSGDENIGINALPRNRDYSTPPLRIVQRMRLEQTQLEGVSRKMEVRKIDNFYKLIDFQC